MPLPDVLYRLRIAQLYERPFAVVATKAESVVLSRTPGELTAERSSGTFLLMRRFYP